MKLQYTLVVALLLIGGALAATADASDSVPTYNELYRDGYHFSPPQNWMNDPNGLVYFNGNYHIFYQYNPYAAEWGHMSWGHAISTDLVHWENLPLAIPEYDNIMIFSGSAIIDTKNASGLCNATAMAQGGCMLAFYAANSASGQAQALAYSNDEGLTFTEYPGNPIINENLTNFRDPKVFWYEPEQKWIMATVLADIYRVRLYTSQDLINWTQLSEFGPAGSTVAAWECPDLFPLVVDGSGTQKWVLITSVAGKVQYFVGDFDGTTFTNENPSNLALFVDQGVDYYAAVTWNDDPQGRRLMIGWLDNWAYAANVPTDVWRGQFTIVRELTLTPTAQGYRLSVLPIDALTQLRTSPVNYTNIHLNQSQNSMPLDLNGTQLDILIDFVYPSAQTGSVPSEFGISVFVGTNQSTVIGYDVSSQSVYVDRTNSGVTSFSSSFPCRTSQSMAPTNGLIQLRILVDQSSVEVFSNDGTLVMSHIIFPDPSQDGVHIFVIGGDLNVSSITGYALNGIWNSTSGVAQDTIPSSEGFLAIV